MTEQQKQKLLADLELVGNSTALSVGLIAYTLNISTDEAQQAIHDLRMQSHRILHNDRGYWLTQSEQEFQRWMNVFGEPALVEARRTIEEIEAMRLQK